MKTFIACCAALLVGMAATLAQKPDASSLEALYEDDAWFELRAAIRGKAVPPLYAGAVAAAFNRVEDAEKHLARAIREASNDDAANEARGVLAMLYIRLGRTSDAGLIIDEILKIEPRRADVENVRVVFGAFKERPNQSVHGSTRSSFTCEVKDDGITVPLSVNGKPVSWLLDTGANITVVSEAEAKMLNLTVQNAARIGDLAGGAAGARTSVARRVSIGETELRNVPMLLMPDDRPPFNQLESGRRGIIGLTVIHALHAIRWSRPSSCQVGSAVSGAVNRFNLAFNRLFPIARTEFDGQPLDFILDTGNQTGTQLWERFARDFPGIVKEKGTRSTQRITQFGGSNERVVTLIPPLRLQVGGLETLLRPANVFSKPVGDDRRHGNLGMDVLSQAAEVTIDLRAMSLSLR